MTFKDLFWAAAGLPEGYDWLTSQVLGRVTPPDQLVGISADSQRVRASGWGRAGFVDAAFGCIEAAHTEPASKWVSLVDCAKVAIRGFRFWR